VGEGWGHGEGDKRTGAIPLELDALCVIEAQVGIIQDRSAIWASAQVNHATQGQVVLTDLHGISVLRVGI